MPAYRRPGLDTMSASGASCGVCVCESVCVCVRACMRACVRACVDDVVGGGEPGMMVMMVCQG